MRKSIYIVVVSSILVVLLFIYLFRNKLPNLLSKQKASDKKETIAQPYKIIYQEKEDTVGRTVVYIGNKGSPLNGSGKVNEKIGTLTIYIGKVLSFENIQDSEDEYITLTDPISKNTLIKARLRYDSNDPTDIRIENLSNITDAEIENIGLANALGKNNAHKIIKPGDIITILLAMDTLNWQPILDENKNPYIARIIIRRFSGSSSIKKELN